MKTSVIILNWNGAEMLKRYLPSVVQYTTDKDTEVIVADNGSTDESLEILKKDFPSVRLIILDKNYGFAEGYNRAISQVDSDYVVLLNSDVEVTEGWLTSMVVYMDEHPDVVAAQPKIMSWLNKSRFEHAGAAGGYLDRLCYPYCHGRILGNVEEDKGQYNEPSDVLWTSGACMLVRTKEYKENGGLDDLFFAHMEEIDLCWRLNCRGYRLVYLPDSTVYHLGGGALNYENPRKTYLNFRNNLLMIYKNMPQEQMVGVMIWRWMLDYVAAAHLLVQGKPRNMWAVVEARMDFWKMKHLFADKRRENMQKATVPYPETITRNSILWDSYFKRK